MTRYGQCWVQPVFASVSGYNWAFFYWLLLAIFGVAAFVIYNARRRLSRGLRETYEARVKSFEQGLFLVTYYGIYWLLVAIFYWSSLPYDTAPDSNPAAWLFCLTFTMRGLSTMAAWLTNHSLKAVAAQEARLSRAGGKYGKVNRQLQPHLNLALRREILHYTTLAIRMSVLRCVSEERMMKMVVVMKSHMRRGGPGGSGGGGPAGGGVTIPLLAGGDFNVANPLHPVAVPSAGGGRGDPRGGSRSPGGGGREGPASAEGSGHHDTFTASTPAAALGRGAVPSVGGGITHDADLAVAMASRVAPQNDRAPTKLDEDLSYGWRPLNIALMASLFEGGGPLDLGEYTLKGGEAANAAAAAAAAAGGGDGSAAGPGAVPYYASGASGTAAAARARAAAETAAKRSRSRRATSRLRSFVVPSAAAAAAAPAAYEEEGGAAKASATPSSASESGVIRRPRLELLDLAPEAFARIRDLFGVSPAQFFYSLSRTTKERFSEGASGAFMCFSHDMRFVLKTMERDEAEVLRRMLPHYLAHLRANRDTLIIRFYACMSLRLYTQTLYFVVMENIFPTKATIHERFGAWGGCCGCLLGGRAYGGGCVLGCACGSAVCISHCAHPVALCWLLRLLCASSYPLRPVFAQTCVLDRDFPP
jgi:hypothetical protein